MTGLGTRTLPSNVDQATSSLVYDEAHLNELKASTPSFRPSISTGDVHDFDTPITPTPGDLVAEGLSDPGNLLGGPFSRFR